MSKNLQGGFIQVIVILIILIGLGVGVYLVQKQTSLKSHASIGDTENSMSLVAYPKDSPPITQPQDQMTINVKPGDLFVVDALIRTPTDEVNLIAAKLAFDKGIIQVNDGGLEVGSKDPFIIRNVTDASFDNNAGTINIVGGIQKPGYKSNVGESGLLARITFKAVTLGEAKISFQSGSVMYKNVDSAELGLVIQRGLTVKVTQNASVPSQAGTVQITINYNIKPGLNTIAVPINTQTSPAEFLSQAKCASMMTRIGNPSIVDFNKELTKTIEKWYPISGSEGDNYKQLTTIESGRSYVLANCSNETTVSLIGTAASMPQFVQGTQDVAVAYGYTKTAKEFLSEISSDTFVCNAVLKRTLSGPDPAQIVFQTVPDSPEYSPNDSLNDKTPYEVRCVSKQDPHFAQLVDMSRYVKPNTSSPITSKPVSHPENYFSLWFDKDQTNLERDIKTMTLSGGQIAGWVKSKAGKMKKMEYAVMNCTPPTGASCKDQPTFTTVFDTIKSENPVAFKVKLATGAPLPALSNLMFRLEDDQGNVLEPVEIYQGKIYENLDAVVKFSMSIGGGSGTSDFSFACEEGKNTISCSKVWVGQPSWYKPSNAAVNLTSPANPTPIPTTIPQKSSDINKDNKVDLKDLSLLLGKWDQQKDANSDADLNSDAAVNTIDYLILRTKLIENGVIKSK